MGQKLDNFQHATWMLMFNTEPNGFHQNVEEVHKIHMQFLRSRFAQFSWHHSFNNYRKCWQFCSFCRCCNQDFVQKPTETLPIFGALRILNCCGSWLNFSKMTVGSMHSSQKTHCYSFNDGWRQLDVTDKLKVLLTDLSELCHIITDKWRVKRLTELWFYVPLDR